MVKRNHAVRNSTSSPLDRDSGGASQTPLVSINAGDVDQEGRKAALEVIRHHRLLEAWLVQTLGYSWDEVHAEAERLEHVISEDFERRIAAAMGHPARDPHGELIPTADLKMPSDESTPLSSLRPSQTATIKRVKASDTELLRYLEGLGLVPGAQIEVTDYSPFDHNLTIKVAQMFVQLSITKSFCLRE
jgi:DtxR family Mn-dependent transcriptional regulator